MSDSFVMQDRVISIHSLRMEGDSKADSAAKQNQEFQSTPSVWRETISSCLVSVCKSFQSTPSVWRETQGSDRDSKLGCISIHSLRMEGDLFMSRREYKTINFNPLPPYGGRLLAQLGDLLGVYISIHSLRMEGDWQRQLISSEGIPFQSTPSVWRETLAVVAVPEDSSFQSTPSVWRETRAGMRRVVLSSISIHSLRMEGDWQRQLISSEGIPFQSTPSVWRETIGAVPTGSGATHFNPLPPYGGRPAFEWFRHWENLFQSTPSVWRETIVSNLYILRLSNFNPLPPYGGRLSPRARRSISMTISIHSLRMEGDFITSFLIIIIAHFNPLPPYGGRRCSMCGFGIHIEISIHSLRMEGDSKTAQESVFHFAYPCTILQKRMQKTTFCTRKNDFFRKKGEKFGAKPPASFCAPMIRTDIFPQTSLTESAALPCLWFPLHRYVPPSTDNDFPGNKTAGCPFLYQSPVPADA